MCSAWLSGYVGPLSECLVKKNCYKSKGVFRPQDRPTSHHFQNNTRLNLHMQAKTFSEVAS